MLYSGVGIFIYLEYVCAVKNDDIKASKTGVVATRKFGRAMEASDSLRRIRRWTIKTKWEFAAQGTRVVFSTPALMSVIINPLKIPDWLIRSERSTLLLSLWCIIYLPVQLTTYRDSIMSLPARNSPPWVTIFLQVCADSSASHYLSIIFSSKRRRGQWAAGPKSPL